MPSHERTAPSVANIPEERMEETVALGTLGSGSCLRATRLRGQRLRG
jgi:hypothetical protein